MDIINSLDTIVCLNAWKWSVLFRVNSHTLQSYDLSQITLSHILFIIFLPRERYNVIACINQKIL